jgi:hypothetical protein
MKLTPEQSLELYNEYFDACERANKITLSYGDWMLADKATRLDAPSLVSIRDIQVLIKEHEIKGDLMQIVSTVKEVLHQHLNENFIDMLDVNGIPYTDAEGIKRNDY